MYFFSLFIINETSFRQILWEQLDFSIYSTAQQPLSVVRYTYMCVCLEQTSLKIKIKKSFYGSIFLR